MKNILMHGSIFCFVSTLDLCGGDQFWIPWFLGLHEPAELMRFSDFGKHNFQNVF